MAVPVIQTNRLTLRPFTLGDGPALFAYAAAPQFSQYVEYDSPTRLQEAQTFLEEVLLSENPDQLTWAMALRDQTDVIGTIQLTRDGPTAVTVHYDISHLHYGKGYTTEAVQAVLCWCISHWPTVTHFLGDTHTLNTGSQRVLEKCGFTRIRSAFVQWEKFPNPVELLFYQVERTDLLHNCLEKQKGKEE